MRLTVRPLPAWPYEAKPLGNDRFKTSYSRTLEDLERELDAIDAREPILGLVIAERDIRLDGMLRADARPTYAGVELSFEVPSRGGWHRLTFHTDVHRGSSDSWQSNLRAIALGLEALRAVNRYGITETGEQYAGFAQIAAGGPDPERGRELVERAGGMREALRRYHPDQGGDQRDIVDVLAYRDQVAVS